MFAERARAYGAPVAFCNLVGGQDELVFDGHSFIVDAEGKTHRPRGAVRGGAAALRDPRVRARPGGGAARPDVAEVYAALTLGLRDYVAQERLRARRLALSGGIDSALVALIAVDALGPDACICVVMPSPHSSEETQADARAIAANLGVRADRDPDRAGDAAPTSARARRDAFERHRAPARSPRRTSRRGSAATSLMALSNKFGWLVLTTGNKSEMSVGYATLYGDMAGGFAVIKDVPKTLVYELVRHRNERRRAAS